MNTAPAALQANFQKAVAAFNAGRLAEAERFCRSVLAVRPNVFDARYLMGLILAGLGQDKQAIESFDRALALRPIADVFNAKATSQQKLKRPADALASYDRAISLNPRYAEALYNRATTLEQLGRLDEAIESYDRAIAARPDFVEAHNNRGNRLASLGRDAEALASYDRALALQPNHVALLHNRGKLLRTMKRLDAAVASYDRALARAPGEADIWNSRAIALQDLGHGDQALQSFERALALKPGDPDLLLNMARARMRLGDAAAALVDLDRALSVKPATAEMLGLRGNILVDLEQVDAAIEHYDRALQLALDSAAVLSDRASARRELSQTDAALADYAAALAIDPDHAESRYGRATLLLSLGRFAEGWPGYDGRQDMASWLDRGFGTPQWDGADVAGKRLLCYAEQGLGDTIQFARFLRLLEGRGIEIMAEVQPGLARIMDGLGGARSVPRGEAVPEHDFNIPLMSLPGLLDAGDDLLAGAVPYLAADPAAVEAWGERLPAGRLRVGVAWQGNPKARVDRGRSVPLAAYAPLAGIDGVTLISLQKNFGLEQLEALPPGMQVELLPDDFAAGPDSFMDTAAVMANLDLIVTSDTSVAHIAGALGRPVWVVLKQRADWRWMQERADSPWYPTARLFRRRADESWDDVLGRVAVALATLAATTR